jgi:hypothetical protein
MMDYVKRGGEFVVVLKTNELYICIYGHFKLQECEKKPDIFSCCFMPSRACTKIASGYSWLTRGKGGPI